MDCGTVAGHEDENRNTDDFGNSWLSLVVVTEEDCNLFVFESPPPQIPVAGTGTCVAAGVELLTASVALNHDSSGDNCP